MESLSRENNFSLGEKGGWRWEVLLPSALCAEQPTLRPRQDRHATQEETNSPKEESASAAAGDEAAAAVQEVTRWLEARDVCADPPLNKLAKLSRGEKPSPFSLLRCQSPKQTNKQTQG